MNEEQWRCRTRAKKSMLNITKCTCSKKKEETKNLYTKKRRNYRMTVFNPPAIAIYVCGVLTPGDEKSTPALL